MCDATCWIAIVRQFPQLFNTDAVDLRLAALVEIKPLNKLFGQRTASSFAEYGYLRMKIYAWLIISFALPFLIDTFIASAYTNHAVIFVVKKVRSGKLWKDIDP